MSSGMSHFEMPQTLLTGRDLSDAEMGILFSQFTVLSAGPHCKGHRGSYELGISASAKTKCRRRTADRSPATTSFPEVFFSPA